jgi:hypothetical protein
VSHSKAPRWVLRNPCAAHRRRWTLARQQTPTPRGSLTRNRQSEASRRSACSVRRFGKNWVIGARQLSLEHDGSGSWIDTTDDPRRMPLEHGLTWFPPGFFPQGASDDLCSWSFTGGFIEGVTLGTSAHGRGKAAQTRTNSWAASLGGSGGVSQTETDPIKIPRLACKRRCCHAVKLFSHSSSFSIMAT